MAGGEELVMEARPLADLGQGWHVAKDLIYPYLPMDNISHPSNINSSISIFFKEVELNCLYFCP